MSLHIQIPCIFENKTLTIKCLDLIGHGKTPDEALIDAIKNTDIYGEMVLATFKTENNFRRSHQWFEVFFNDKILKRIMELEPTPTDASIKKKRKNILTDVSPEDVLDYGYEA